ncbi:MAG: hypothetical protein D9C04_01865 [Nitrosopumilus sp. B06]|nr:MAG: hypothetical protein EB828_04225 [Nitrosopumilus sp. D6]RNJ80327.1 MAG: hypothetical protein D9C04_01865 [Nitrosopumilus sp. B06]
MEKTHLVMMALMLVPLATVGAMQMATADEAPYSAENASHAFEVMDLFAVVNADYYLVIDEAGAAGHAEVTELDLAIALDFATYHNAIVDAVKAGPEDIVGDLESANPELAEAIRALENSRFSVVFDSDIFEDKLLEEMPYGNVGAVLITVYYILHIF